MLYRLTEVASWEQAQQDSFFASPDLTEDGFIHSSTLGQVLETARRHYQGRGELVLFEIDEAALATDGVRVEREWAAGRGDYFPHIFGPIFMHAVRRVWSLPEAGGDFELPAELAAEK